MLQHVHPYNDADVDLCENLAMLTAIAIYDKGLNLGFAEEKKSIISLRGVTKVFGQGDTQIQILKGVNLDVREGEFLVILGTPRSSLPAATGARTSSANSATRISATACRKLHKRI